PLEPDGDLRGRWGGGGVAAVRQRAGGPHQPAGAVGADGRLPCQTNAVISSAARGAGEVEKSLPIRTAMFENERFPRFAPCGCSGRNDNHFMVVSGRLLSKSLKEQPAGEEPDAEQEEGNSRDAGAD